MKQSIRRGVFETNSSSTHSLTMCSEDEYEKWIKGELYFIPSTEEFVNEEGKVKYLQKKVIKSKAIYDYTNRQITYKGVTVSFDDKEKLFTEENLNEITKEEVENFVNSHSRRLTYYDIPVTCEEYDEYIAGDYETFESSYTTKNGEKIISFGYYGYDG